MKIPRFRNIKGLRSQRFGVCKSWGVGRRLSGLFPGPPQMDNIVLLGRGADRPDGSARSSFNLRAVRSKADSEACWSV